MSTTDNPVTVSLSQADDTVLSCTLRLGESVSQPHSHILRSLSQIPCTEKKASFHSLNDVKQCYTPDIFVEGNKESYWLRCTEAGLFQCKVTDLVFNMEGEGDVIYRTVPWNPSLLAQLGKRPAGPLFDIKRHQGSVCQLHLPHCEILPPVGGKSLSVGHVIEDRIELSDHHVITETHVIIDITEFSAYGILDDVNSPNPKRAMVPLFYTPPIDDNDPRSTLNVLLLPGNVVLSEVIDERRRRDGEEIYIESPLCNLIPNKEYTLSTSPQEKIAIEPNSTTFDVESYHNYTFAFRVTLKRRLTDVKLRLRDSITSDCAWESGVYLRKHQFKVQVQHIPNHTAEDKLLSVRRSLIDRVSFPVLKSVQDELLEKGVLTDAETEEANTIQVRKDKARFVIDTVRRKGPVASSSMISFLCEMDPHLSEALGLEPITQQNGSEHPQPRRSGRQLKGRPDGASKEKTQPRKRKIPS